MRTVVEVVLGRMKGDQVTLYECRHCGTAVNGPEATCPDCGNEDIAVFELDSP